MNEPDPKCAQCPYDWSNRYCRSEEGKAPKFCPSVAHQQLARAAVDEMPPDIRHFACQASIQEAQGYADRHRGYENIRPAKPRIEEVIEFAQKMDYHHIALIFCVGLRREAAIVNEILDRRGFDVLSIVCKVGRVEKECLGLTDEQKIRPGEFESMCHPVLQAKIANHHHSQFNILLGLCVGHDSLFFKYSSAPCTVLAVKDRLLGHNPLAAIYQYDAYYRYLKTS